MKHAWIENNRIRDIAPGNPMDYYTPNVAAYYDTEVPDEAQNGWELVEDVWTAPPAPEPASTPEPVVIPPAVSPIEFKLLFTAKERVEIKTARATDPIIDDFYDLVEDPRLEFIDLNLQSNQDAIGYLCQQGLLTEERAAEILLGQLV